jgi:hypothetical protein
LAQGLLQLAAVGVEEQAEQNGEQQRHERDLPGAVGALALDQPGAAVDAQAVGLAAVAERTEPGGDRNVFLSTIRGLFWFAPRSPRSYNATNV